ncbi:MAG: translation elongation factor 4 [Bacteroidia bacterium]|jgi:GTP-binding protein LepA|nr:translation elongation factor 4 [Bacteroidia bacterium]GIV23282.1 MAG: elongation factor 4 [Bacteroidia bacterium]
MRTAHIRNFCIIAHIDHGKSTLADRLLEATGTLSQREMMDQVLDSMDLEREKGITIKSHPVQMHFQGYTLNLIDTPGHVDFSYEVSRAIAACEGALLVVDASQGIQAQTLANLYLALEQDLEIIPVLNKIDLPAARPDEIRDQVVELLGCKPEEVIYASAKEGIGISEILQAIIERIPPPPDRTEKPLRALIFDSQFDPYRGAIAYVRVKEGEIRPGQRIRLMATDAEYTVEEVGIFQLKRQPRESIPCGSVGYVIAGIKNIQEIKVGDTITDARNPAEEPLKGFREMKPMVFAGFYPVDSSQFEDLRETLEKLRLNDAAIQFEPETSAALGFGFRVGFLGMLHMEIVQERLSREFGMEVLATVPNVPYHAYLHTGEMLVVTNPAHFPDPAKINRLEEPFVRVQIITDAAFIGSLMELCISRRGVFKNQTYLSPTRVELIFEMPLAEVIFDFYDRLKSLSRGYASLDYELIGYRPSDLVRMDILLNGERIDALSCIIHRDKAYDWGRRLCQKLKELIPRQQFEIAIQAAIYGRIIARETLKALRKDVTAKCYGGDITRKRKLLERQKEGKKRMRQLGSVEVPQEAFMAVLKLD